MNTWQLLMVIDLIMMTQCLLLELGTTNTSTNTRRQTCCKAVSPPQCRSWWSPSPWWWSWTPRGSSPGILSRVWWPSPRCSLLWALGCSSAPVRPAGCGPSRISASHIQLLRWICLLSPFSYMKSLYCFIRICNWIIWHSHHLPIYWLWLSHCAGQLFYAEGKYFCQRSFNENLLECRAL